MCEYLYIFIYLHNFFLVVLFIIDLLFHNVLQARFHHIMVKRAGIEWVDWRE